MQNEQAAHEERLGPQIRIQERQVLRVVSLIEETIDDPWEVGEAEPHPGDDHRQEAKEERIGIVPLHGVECSGDLEEDLRDVVDEQDDGTVPVARSQI